ncbi:MAG: glycosyltransferase, partial [Nanoarchaeota archaeon]|nr:glycosyltransferase [Nanoarchaeota archaeon]
YWPKNLGSKESTSRSKAFYYSEMHSNAFGLVKKGVKILNGKLNKITSPILIVHSMNDTIARFQGSKRIFKCVKTNKKEICFFDTDKHNLFFSEEFSEVKKLILSFIKKYQIFETKKKKEKISAIVPAFNEGKRISNVLRVLAQTKILDEIIVVDDGSKDETESIVKDLSKTFPKIKYLKNKINKGKAYSMDRGVKSSSGDIIFFSDADLKGLTTKAVEEIINPVLNNEVDMFIGARGNFMQRAVKKWAINSGERALRKEIWMKLPSYYKHRFRIEAGLNLFVKNFGKGYDYKIFDYSQTLKEKKYGFLKGTFFRWWMNFDVAMAVIRFNLFDRFRKIR